MWYRVAVDAVVVAHLLFIGSVIFGSFFAWRWPRAAWVHVPVAVYGAMVEFVGFTCPLTPLEKYLRRRAEHGGTGAGSSSITSSGSSIRPASPGRCRMAWASWS